jgi:hypothetical protein
MIPSMDREPIYVPFGFPPGVDQGEQAPAPDAILYFRIYAGLIILLCLAIAGVALFALIEFSRRAPGATAGDDMLIWTSAYGSFAVLMSVPWVVAVFAGRRAWVHTLGTVLIILTMVTVCYCLPIAIPLLISWLKPEVKRWYATV